MAKVPDEADKHAEESPPDPFQNIADFSPLRNYGCLTIAQCSIIASVMLLGSKVRDEHYEVSDHYNGLAFLDIGIGLLDPRHPLTRIPYSEYQGMIEAGMFGNDEADRPVLTCDWLIPIDEAEQWLQSKDVCFSKGLKFDFDALRAQAAGIRRESKPAGQAPASGVSDWRSQARVIADECFDRDTRNNCRDSLKGYSRRVTKEMQKQGIQGPHGAIDNPDTVMRDALQAKKWWRNKQT